MMIDLLVQKTVVHNFLRIPESTFPLLHSRVQNGIKPFFYSNNDDDLFQHRWNFRLNTICRSLRNDDWFTGPKTVVHNFLRIPQYTFRFLQSTVEMESSRSSSQTMTTTSFNIFKTFAWIPFVEASEMRIDFLVQKAVVHNFLRIPQSTFTLLHSRVQMEWRRSSTQTMTTTSLNIVQIFV